MEIAREYGIPQSVVTRHRNKLGIRSFRSVNQEKIRHKWDSVGLGKCLDKEISQKLGVHISCVIRERQKRGIPPYQKGLGRTARAYPIKWSDIPLGLKSDNAIGHGLGVSGSCVRYQRLERNIPSFKERHIVTDWSKIPLGKVPDWLIAGQTGKSVDSICVARSSRGIPPFAAVCKTTEGQTCNAPEGMIDLYWHENNIPHEFQVRLGRFIADWRINGNTIVEYSGWEAHPKYGYIYLERLARKKLYYKSLGYKVLIITRKHLNRFKSQGTPAYMRVCGSCHKPVPSFQRGLCKVCYKRQYLRPKI